MNDERFPPERAQLEAGWAWLERNGPDDPRHSDFYDRWLERLHEYERFYGLGHGEEEERGADDLDAPMTATEASAIVNILFGDGLVDAVKAGRQEKDSPFAPRFGDPSRG